jgi:hypothetical protein
MRRTAWIYSLQFFSRPCQGTKKQIRITIKYENLVSLDAGARYPESQHTKPQGDRVGGWWCCDAWYQCCLSICRSMTGRTDVGKRTIAPNEEAELDEVESKLTRRSTFTHTSPLCMTVSGSNTSWVVRSVGFEEKAGPGRVMLLVVGS